MELLERLSESEEQVATLARKAKSAPLRTAMHFVARLLKEAAIEITKLRTENRRLES